MFRSEKRKKAVMQRREKQVEESKLSMQKLQRNIQILSPQDDFENRYRYLQLLYFSLLGAQNRFG